MAAFPVRVEMISRFRSAKEQSDIVQRLARGEIDIIIGTHRLLSKDVTFKDLGLLVIDEEQRFGVRHKERIKQLRTNVDVITLTATPIPRTLHMALAGIRDLSVINTPPEDRIPIKTYVLPYDENLIREAILRELDRGGQVYFVHNRVQSIYYVADRLRQLVPEARIAVGHGQLDERELERVMLDFFTGKDDVLVCTTIIESGLMCRMPTRSSLTMRPASGWRSCTSCADGWGAARSAPMRICSIAQNVPQRRKRRSDCRRSRRRPNWALGCRSPFAISRSRRWEHSRSRTEWTHRCGRARTLYAAPGARCPGGS